MDDPPGVIDLTTASEEDLCGLTGVGPALARRIVTWRTDRGGFSSVDQLAEVRGIGEARMEALRPYVVAAPAPAPAPRPSAASRPREPAAGRLAALSRADRVKVALIGLAVLSQIVVVALVLWVV